MWCYLLSNSLTNSFRNSSQYNLTAVCQKPLDFHNSFLSDSTQDPLRTVKTFEWFRVGYPAEVRFLVELQELFKKIITTYCNINMNSDEKKITVSQLVEGAMAPLATVMSVKLNSIPYFLLSIISDQCFFSSNFRSSIYIQPFHEKPTNGTQDADLS